MTLQTLAPATSARKPALKAGLSQVSPAVMESIETPRPDPALTASIYCSGHLDAVVQKVIGPFWEEFQRRTPGSDRYLWVVRYNKCGEHLKVRLHGAKDHCPLAKRILEKYTHEFFASMDEGDDPPLQRSLKTAPPIDREDYATLDYPDRTLLWTEYQRSDVCLGSEPFLHDDKFVALLTRTLAEGLEVVLNALVPVAAGKIRYNQRQTTLLKILITGLGSLDFSPQRRLAYLAYHRDWLIRFATTRSNKGPEKCTEIVERFDHQIDQMGSVVAGLGQQATRHWASGPSPQEPAGEPAGWPGSLVRLKDHAAGFAHLPEYNIDPFTSDQVFPRIFKAFHGIGNQLGLDMLNEALSYHLLARGAAPKEPIQPTRLIPRG